MKLDDLILTEEKFEIIEKQAHDDMNAMPDAVNKLMDWQAFDLPNIQYEWSKRYKRQKFVVESLKDELAKIRGEKFDHYKFHDNYNHETTKEIESYIDFDKEWCQKKKLYQIQLYYLEAIEEWYDLIKRLDYKTHDYLEYKKMELTKY